VSVFLISLGHLSILFIVLRFSQMGLHRRGSWGELRQTTEDLGIRITNPLLHILPLYLPFHDRRVVFNLYAESNRNNDVLRWLR
jgi:hypothetical protein